MRIIVATLIMLGVIASVLAQDFATWDYWLLGGNALRSEVVRNLGLLIAAVIGLVVGSWRAVAGYNHAQAAKAQAAAATEQARIAQQGQITNLFSTAVEHLGSGVPDFTILQACGKSGQGPQPLVVGFRRLRSPVPTIAVLNECLEGISVEFSHRLSLVQIRSDHCRRRFLVARRARG